MTLAHGLQRWLEPYPRTIRPEGAEAEAGGRDSAGSAITPADPQAMEPPALKNAIQR